MSVVPSRHFYPPPTFISFPFTRYNLSSYCSLTTYIKNPCCNFPNNQNPSCEITPKHVNTHWLAKWNKHHYLKLPKQPKPMLNYREKRQSLVLNSSLGSNGSTMDRIVEKLKKFGYADNDDDDDDDGDSSERRIEKGSVEDIFYVEDGMLPDKRGGFSSGSLLGVGGGGGGGGGGDGVVRFPWEEGGVKDELGSNSVRKRSRTFMAELTLPDSEIKRLTSLTFRTKHKMRIGGGGVTQAVVDSIHDKWKNSEIVRIKVEGAPALNMRRMHEILERKTGGLVVWRSGTSVSLYRGVSYEVPQVETKKWMSKKKGAQVGGPSLPYRSQRNASQNNTHESKHVVNNNFHKTMDEKKDSEVVEVIYEDEIDKLLSQLGPRYTDWPGGDPLPIDADLLPNIVPGYKPPFRLLPFGVRPSLSRNEATALRRIARTLPPHFAVGRSRHLEGLAEAIVKLWERSSIAKVALKRGVQLTTSERMAEEIKRLTGGILLSRNKDFLVYYRGKNFLSFDVTQALLEREKLAKDMQDEEEQARMKGSSSALKNADIEEYPRGAGTLYETMDANAKWGKRIDDEEKEKLLQEAEFFRHSKLVRKLEHKLALAEKKLSKAEQTLSKVEEFLKPADRQQDPDSISDEERFMFRKLGLRMKAFLLLGRRGVFDGTVENMHLHWKYRELVKIIVKARSLEDAKTIALSLEAESGGILVSLDKVSKGYAIIVYRGKDYQRPSSLRPKNLLTKRKALARSIELQRREALLKHIAQLQKNAEKLRSEIGQMNTMRDQNDAEFYYDSLDAAYPSDDEDSEEEGDDDAYLETYDNESDEDENGNHIHSFHPETKMGYDIHNQNIEPGLDMNKEGQYRANDDIYDYDDDSDDDDGGEHFGSLVGGR